MKTKKKQDPRKLPEHDPKPVGELVAKLLKHIDTSQFNNLTITSFDTAKCRDDELQRKVYETVFILGKAEETEEAAANTLSRKGKAILMGGLWRDRGVALLKEGKPNDAIEAWKRSIRYSLSEPQESPLPHPTAFIQTMADTGLDEYHDLMACANNIAQVYIEQERLPEALDWLNECMCLHRSSGTANEPSSLAWFTVIYPYEEFNILYLQMMMRWENVFWKLGNTSAAHAAIYDADSHRATIFRGSDVLKATIQSSTRKYTEMRHPDPRNIEGMKLISPDLQIRGAWRKLRVTSTPTTLLTPRAGASTAVYNGCFYVFGGEHYDTSSLKDGWALNLKDLNGWRPVPGPPPGTPPICQQPLIVYEAKGYLFQGQNVLRVFDFKTETWHQVITRLRTGEPWRKLIPKNCLIAFAAHLYKGKIYVFGGRQEWGECGRNVMMSLDIKTLLWDVWSGTPEVKGDVTIPGPRAHACSWIVDDKFYLSLGSAKRQELGTGWDHLYVDIWSFDLLAHKWVEEKFTGNTPCFRTQSSHTFNDAWNKALIFGGYNARLPWSQPDPDSFAMGAYFADTYAWCPENKRWLQVITKSFPTYRCGAEMFTDQSTGRTYLFGGWVATCYAASRKPKQFKLFGDLWELVIDCPKSSFIESDFDSADPRFSQLGPWVRCYHCGSVGRWMSCSGSCRRTSEAASFCGKECQRLAWPEHKRSCRKV